VGVLALQGGFARHLEALAVVGHTAVEVRGPRDLRGLDGLVLPGGESTTQLKLIARAALEPALAQFVGGGKPVLATCAGLILAACSVVGPEQASFGWLDVEVSRNAYGRQVHSFEGRSDKGLHLVFIRAPRILSVGAGVEVVDTFNGEPVWIRQGNVVGCCFHPELSGATEVHRSVFGVGAAQGVEL